MSDIVIKPADMSMNYRPKTVTPVYLVMLNFGNSKTNSAFIATKFEDGSSNCPKFIGFYSDASVDSIKLNYASLIETTAKESYEEVIFPWSRILNITNLIFKQK